MHVHAGLSLSFGFWVLAASGVASAQKPAPLSTTTPPSEGAPDAGEPPLPPPATEQAPAAAGDEGGKQEPISEEQLARLKAEMKAELTAELRQQMQAEMDAATRDVQGQRGAALEWEAERWVEEVRPQLNFLELDGYFRLRGDLFNRLDLGTYDPVAQRGTSSVPPPTLNGAALDACTDAAGTDAPAICSEEANTLTSMNMRLRVRPTLHISEDIRLKSTVDIFDNLVMGSLPEVRPGLSSRSVLPLPYAMNQEVPVAGTNALYDALQMRRVWAEVMTPFGELRFGRQPLDFGMGLLANGGEQIDQDYQDTVDGVFFSTRVAGHTFVPGYAISSSGPIGRGGGAGDASNVSSDGSSAFLFQELGQRYNLDPRDDIHTFLLTVSRTDKEDEIKDKVAAGDWVFNYGAFGYFQTQQYDIPAFQGSAATSATASEYVLRNANTGALSLWAKLLWDKLTVEAEAVGVLGRIDNTSVVSDGIESADPAMLGNPLWLLQGGAAVESSYAFLNNSLVVGLDAGIASGDAAPGFGLRPVAQRQPRLGDLDGQQYGACTARNDAGECTEVDNFVTNYRFDPAYNIDLILFREILGTVTDAAYFKPHLAYYITETFGVRGDLIYSNALNAASTPGLTSPLGVEGDGTVFYTSEDGFVMMLQGGVFFPLGGFNHPTVLDGTQVVSRPVGGVSVRDTYLQAQFSYTLQALVGVAF